MDLEKFAADMMKMGQGACLGFAKENREFIPTLVILAKDGISPVPFPHYARDRAFHIGLIKNVLAGCDADAFAFVMEVWYSEHSTKGQKTPIKTEDFPLPSKDPNRKEALVVQCSSRDGGDIVLIAEIKRHGHKVSFKDVIDMTDKELGRGAMSLMSNMFGRETMN